MTATPTPQRDSTAKYAWAEGLVTFGAVMLLVAGLLSIFRGIMGIANDDVFYVTRDYVFHFDLTGWGWIHLILGAIAVIISVGLFQGAAWARVLGVVVAVLIIITHFMALPYSPVWSFVVIAVSVLIIWALCLGRPEETSTR
ncbi:hypothetical protein [Streptomyces sp. V3I7]|uniref:DUF7144 family membrane protein n=1 Tax=Streptomyces sp. V3I7 TaxID=3042278 RepID=UPI00277D1D51|nr:hypothetical protein [Streptomyces sp. V3I7]MDQ0989520.1 hypothetical protein [Streptomyces sp. V3I7]